MKTRDYLTDSDIDELMEDWFERDGETFMKIRDKGRIGWEETLKEGEAYSTYLLESPTKLELLKGAYSLAKDMISVMDIPFKVRIIISTASSTSATDGRTLQVATKMFDDDGISVGEQLDAFIGTTIHEGCHLVYTDFGALGRRPITSAVKMLANVIEDERIEQTLGQDKPGLARFLEKSKYYWFDSFYMDYHTNPDNLFEKLFNIFLRIMRYPTYLVEDDIVFFGHHLFKIKDIVKVLPTSTEETLDQAEAVFEVFKEFYEEEDEKRREDGESEFGDGESEFGDGEEGEDDAGESRKSRGEKDSGDGETSETDSKSSYKKRDIIKDVSEVSSPKRELTAPERITSSDMSSDIGGEKAGIVDGTLSTGKSKHTFFKLSGSDKDNYLSAYNNIRRYIPAVSKAISGHMREYKLIHKSMRSGTLDTTKLAEAYQGVSTVYMREGEVRTDKVSVVVLLDESGSMVGRRIASARDTAILINEAIGKIPQVELFIYGHSGDMLYSGATEITIYRDLQHRDRYALGSILVRSENRDGVAIYETALRVREQTKNPTLMFILSDGAPSAHAYRDPDTTAHHVRESVKKVEKMGFSVVQVCINHVYDPATMFKHFVILEDMSRLAIDLGKVIKKATINAAKVHQT